MLPKSSWQYLADAAPLVLAALMVVSWWVPNRPAALVSYTVVFLFTALAVAVLRSLLTRAQKIANAVAIAIGGFGLIYAWLLRHAPTSGSTGGGSTLDHLGHGFLMAVGVGATAGTFDLPIDGSIRFVIFVELLVFGLVAATAFRKGIKQTIKFAARTVDGLRLLRISELNHRDEVVTFTRTVASQYAALSDSLASKADIADLRGSNEELLGRLGHVGEQVQGLSDLIESDEEARRRWWRFGRRYPPDVDVLLSIDARLQRIEELLARLTSGGPEEI